MALANTAADVKVEANWLNVAVAATHKAESWPT